MLGGLARRRYLTAAHSFDPEMTERSMMQATLLGLPFYIKQQYKLLRPMRMLDLIANTDVISVRPKRFEGKKGVEGKRRERPRSAAQVNNISEADWANEDTDFQSERERLN